ncbi:unnamed protein product, partial [Chrysoparadoxa australica]
MNETDPFAVSVHGTNPQNLVEKITRNKIYGNRYWKEHCFGLTAETLVDKAIEIKYLGGVYGGIAKPTEFLCLVLKTLQLQPEKDIILEYIKNEDFKYLRLLGAFYLRLVGTPKDIYQYMEPLYNDYRKVRWRNSTGWAIRHVDEVVDELLKNDMCCDITLPRLPKRMALEDVKALKPRTSVLAEEWMNDEALLAEEEEEEAKPKEPEKAKSGDEERKGRHGSRGGSRRSRERGRHDRDRNDRDRDRDRDRRRRGDSRDRGRGDREHERRRQDERERDERRRDNRRHRDDSRDRDRRGRGGDERRRDGTRHRGGREHGRDRSRERRGHDNRGRVKSRRDWSRSRSRSRSRRWRSRSRSRSHEGSGR